MDEDWVASISPGVGVVGILAKAIIYLCSLYASHYYFSTYSKNASAASYSDDERCHASSSKHRAPACQQNCPPVRLTCVPFDGPSFRTEPGMIVDEVTGNIVIHGGDSSALLADVNVFDVDKLEWEEYPFTPNNRNRFGMVSLPTGEIIVFGGMDRQVSDSLSTITFSSKGFDWTDSESKGKKPWPAARHGHAMCLCGYQVAVFGGHDASGKQLNDLWLLNTSISEEGPSWIKVEVKGYGRPKSRTKPCIAHLDGSVFLFGQTSRARGEIEFFRLNGRGTGKWERQVTCGEEPLEQNCQLHALESAAQLVSVSNVETSSCGLFNRVDILDTLTKPMTWSRVDLKWQGDYTMIPGQRSLFSSAMDSTGLLYIFGGLQGGTSNDNEEEGRQYLNTLIVANFGQHFASEDMDG